MSGDGGVEVPPPWKMPTGVNASLWHYVHSDRLAADEDAYFRDHPLFRADTEALRSRWTEPGSLIDLGCGAGRLSLDFARRGFDVTSVDLSQPMLAKVREKARLEDLSIRTVRANLCRLGCFPGANFDMAIAMFSTLGMIRGAVPRRRAMVEIHRVLKPGGRLALHAHNLWLNLWDRQGRRWLLEQAGRYARGAGDAGDRTMTYRGVPGMEVHLYRWSELRADLRSAGFTIDETLALDAVSAKPIALPRIIPGLRAGGWIVFASRAST